MSALFPIGPSTSAAIASLAESARSTSSLSEELRSKLREMLVSIFDAKREEFDDALVGLIVEGLAGELPRDLILFPSRTRDVRRATS